MPWSFVHPGIAAATAALALLPLLIHLINRRRYRREPWAAVAFLLKAHRRSRRRIQLQQWLLLVLRTLVILFVGMTVARPYAKASAPGTTLGRAHARIAIILDDSLSMQARLRGGGTAFEAAKAAALEVLDSAPAGDGIAVVTAAAPAKAWMDRPVHDRSAVRRAVESLTCSSRTTDLDGALRLAADLFADGDAEPGARVAYVITDFTLASVGGAADPALAPLGDADFPAIDRIYLIDVGPRDRDNLAVRSLQRDGQTAGPDTPVLFSVEVANLADVQVDRTAVEIRLDGATLRTLQVGPLPARGSVCREFLAAYGPGGPHRLSAGLVSAGGDALSIDDRCYLAMDAVEGLAVLLVEGRPDAQPVHQALFYYAAAVSPGDEAVRAAVRAAWVPASGLGSEVLDDYEVVVLGDVARLSRQAWARLERYVRAGGGLIVFPGEGLQTQNYNRFAAAGGNDAPLLPVQLTRTATIPPDAQAVTFRIEDAHHPALIAFLTHDRGGLGSATVRRYWHVKAPEAARTGRTLMRFSNGDPALITHTIGRGIVLMWTTGADMTATNLPAKPDFVPLMLSATLFAAGDDAAHRNVQVGDAIIQPIPAGMADLTGTVEAEDGTIHQAQPEPHGDGLAIVFRSTEQPGFYDLQIGNLRRAAAVNVDARESDLRRADPAVLQARFGPKAVLVEPGKVVRAETLSAPRELAQVFMILLASAVFLETFAAMRFGHPS